MLDLLMDHGIVLQEVDQHTYENILGKVLADRLRGEIAAYKEVLPE